MQRITIDYGIDLGTTNSSIALFENSNSEIIKNALGHDITPSAVWAKKNKKDESNISYYVGDKAKRRIGQPDVYTAFKRQMGKSYQFKFSGSDDGFTPEQLSAEVLKELRKDVQNKKQEIIKAAVVTVPAAFDLAACDATKRAVELAGFEKCSLIMEPVAASIAYGFDSEDDRKFWLVYDLGGGTFDAAVVNVRDGVIKIVSHGGDMHLGGTNIDEKIANNILVPAIEKEYDVELTEGGIGYLKYQAELAKIELSQAESVDVMIDNPIIKDKHGEVVEIEYRLNRSEIEPFIAEIAEKTINISKNVLDEKKLKPGDIEKVLLVGGPTLTPLLRDMLNKELGIPLEFRIDPLTVIARGAAIFAGSQIFQPKEEVPLEKGTFAINLDYEPVGNDLEPIVGGRVIPANPEETKLTGYTLEFINQKTEWKSGKTVLPQEGTFIKTLKAEKGSPNVYKIELRDEGGIVCKTAPEKFSYSVGLTVADIPLINSLGVALSNGEMQVFIEKGTPLPARTMKRHRTTRELVKGQTGQMLSIPILEGENELKADRNLEVGKLDIVGENITRNLPKGSEVEITVEVDDSRLVRTHAYVPHLDQEFEKVHYLQKDSPNPDTLNQEINEEKAKMNRLKQEALNANAPKAEAALKQIETENLLEEIEENASMMLSSEDAADRTTSLLIQLKGSLDDVSYKLEWPSIISDLKEAKEFAEGIVRDFGDNNDASRLQELLSETKAAYEVQDALLIKLSIQKIRDFAYSIYIKQPEAWVGYFEYLNDFRSDMTDQAIADKLFAQGNRALNENDVEGLKAAVKQLIDLLPEEQQEEAKIYKGSTMPI